MSSEVKGQKYPTLPTQLIMAPVITTCALGYDQIFLPKLITGPQGCPLTTTLFIVEVGHGSKTDKNYVYTI